MSFSPCCSLLTVGDLSPTFVSLWSFIQIAKEKFSMPLRDNYQTVKLPHSSCWVITFSPSLLFFSPEMKPSVFKALTIDNSPALVALRLLNENCEVSAIMLALKGFLPLAHVVFLSLSYACARRSLILTFTQTRARPICILGNYIQFVNQRWTLVELDFANRRNDI